MKVLHLSAASENAGAGKGALLTHRALSRLGIDSTIMFLKSELQEEKVVSYHKLAGLNKIRRFISTYCDKSYLAKYKEREPIIFSPGMVGLKLKNNKYIRAADIIHLHWVNHGFVDLAEIKSWGKPVVWTLRDMWPFTGGCHQSFECTGYQTGCGNCPVLHSGLEHDLSRIANDRKHKAYRGVSNLHWVAVSDWMKSRAEESHLLANAEITTVYSGVDSNDFELGDKQLFRKELQLPADANLILVGAGNIREKFKGFEFVVSALNNYHPDGEILVITFGAKSFEAGEVPFPVKDFGKINSKTLKKLYNSADLFLGPSIADALGKTFIEAQLCGLPVICFDKTGPAEIVEHLTTGYVAGFGNAADLIKGLEFCLGTSFDREAIREKAVAKFDIINCSKDYIRVYEKCLMGRPIGK